MLTSHPEWVEYVHFPVERIESNIFGEVRQRLLWIQVQIIPRIVTEFGVYVHCSILDERLFVLFQSLNHSTVKEGAGEDFVDGRDDHTVCIRSVTESDAKGVHEHALVNIHPGPNGSLVECIPVFGIIEDLEESNGFFEVVLVHD